MTLTLLQMNGYMKIQEDILHMCSDELMLGSIAHAATIEVDRNGTRLAAASSSFYVTGTLQNHEDRKVIVDRPFVYAIMHDESELPIVVGNVNRLETMLANIL